MYEQTNQCTEVMILGVAVDNLTLNATVKRILFYIKSYRYDRRPRQVATMNVDFLMNALNWRISKPARHPELLDILRSADLVTADGMPIVWLSHMLKTPLYERVTGADLVPALAKASSETGHSIFFLGGSGESAQQAADKLKSVYPKLNIAGVYSPFVYTQGEQMLSSEKQDKEIISRINKVNPDILLVGFGNPKQELWFNRNRHKLNVAVTIGIGGTYEFIAGTVNRAPVWMQNSGLEWIYRILQDPKRLWKRYAVGMIKLAYLSIPLLLQDKLQRYRLALLPEQQDDRLLDVNSGLSLDELVIGLAKCLDVVSLSNFENNWEQCAVLHKKVIFDFTRVEFIDSSGLGKLVRIIKRLQRDQVKTSITGLLNTDVIKLLKITRTFDLITESVEPEKQSPGSTLVKYKSNNKEKFITIVQQSSSSTTAKLAGRLDAAMIDKLDFSQSVKILGDGDYILDISGLTFLDSSGLRFLFYLHKNLKGRNKKLALVQPGEMVLQLLKITNLSHYFNISNNSLQMSKL